MLVVVVLASASGCRGAFANDKNAKEENAEKKAAPPAMDPRCSPQTSALVASPDAETVAWRVGEYTVCWQNRRTHEVKRHVFDARPIADEQGVLHFTPDGRSLTIHVTMRPVSVEMGRLGIQPDYPAKIFVDVNTGIWSVVPDEPGAEQRILGSTCDLSPDPTLYPPLPPAPPPRVVRRVPGRIAN